jgi:hypothetical protein
MGGRIVVKRGRIRVPGSASPAAGRLEVELHLACDRAGDALAVAGQALDRFAC